MLNSITMSVEIHRANGYDGRGEDCMALLFFLYLPIQTPDTLDSPNIHSPPIITSLHKALS